ncbi:cupin domain-containing protein [Sorangium sp. So ce1335]|uniref:cupin domain-containing protein n=1 Tax=Sorangium sp. So ce1335 TaxID=3133335 RepID=UPI003F5EFD52
MTRVEVQRLMLPPGFKAGPHTHPGPVVCYVTEGRILFQVKGQPARYYTAGQTIFEPASTPIERFDNDSSSGPATFIATYLLGDQDTELLHRLHTAGGAAAEGAPSGHTGAALGGEAGGGFACRYRASFAANIVLTPAR